jgi:hypothetical protein
MEPKFCYYVSLITLLYGEMRNCSINNSWGQEGQVCNSIKNSQWNWHLSADLLEKIKIHQFNTNETVLLSARLIDCYFKDAVVQKKSSYD